MSHILITGAGTGIGLACARRFSQMGAATILTGRRTEPLKAAATELGQAVDLVCDVSSTESVDALFAELDDRGVRIGTLINNAGIFLPAKVLESDDELALQQLQVNLLGAWRMLKACADRSIAAGEELTVVNVLSVTATGSYPSCGFYGASKAALKSLMETARLELRGKGVRITNLFPGATETPVWGDAGIDPAKLMDADEVARAILSATLVQGRSQVEDIVLRPRLGDF